MRNPRISLVRHPERPWTPPASVPRSRGRLNGRVGRLGFTTSSGTRLASCANSESIAIMYPRKNLTNPVRRCAVNGDTLRPCVSIRQRAATLSIHPVLIRWLARSANTTKSIFAVCGTRRTFPLRRHEPKRFTQSPLRNGVNEAVPTLFRDALGRQTTQRVRSYAAIQPYDFLRLQQTDRTMRAPARKKAAHVAA